MDYTSKASPFYFLTVLLTPVVHFFSYLFFVGARYFLINFLSKANSWGQIVIKFPEEDEPQVFGDLQSERKVFLDVRDSREFVKKCIMRADLGLAESYMDGDFECDDVTLLLQIFIANRDQMNGLDTNFAFVAHLFNRMSHLNRANTLLGSKKNIEEHYDLSNDMFELFLDESMTYSSAIFNDPSESLHQGQLNKLNAMIAKAEICSTDHVLEIGSGWGSFAIRAASSTGCKVTTITLSKEQKELAEKRIKEAGLQDKITVLLIDYRDMVGQFDKIVSIEMLEAVGEEFIPTYFEHCSKLLKPNGKMAFQVITTPSKSYEVYRKGCDFIQKYIFPGSLCPSLNKVLECIEESSDLKVEKIDNIGYDYARTLREWRTNFIKNKKQIMKLRATSGDYFDTKFFNTWIWYFCYCEAGFKSQYIGVHQIVLSHPKYLQQ